MTSFSRTRGGVAVGEILHARPLVEMLRHRLAKADGVGNLTPTLALAVPVRLLLPLGLRLLHQLRQPLRGARTPRRLRQRVERRRHVGGRDARLDEDAVLRDVRAALSVAALADGAPEARMSLARC